MTREKLMHPATFISLAALFVALGGAGYAATKVGTNQIKNRAVTNKKLANNSVGSAKIRTGGVANSDLANGAVGSAKIRDNAIITSKLADASVLSGKLADASVTSGKLAPGSVDGTAIAANSVSAGQVVDGQLVEGNGVLMNRETILPNGASNTPILDFAGLGTLQGDCAGGDATIEFVNTSGTAIDVRQWGVVSGAGATITSSNPANGQVIQQSTQPNGVAGITWMASFRDTGGLHLVTINVSTKNVGGATCVVSAQGLFTTG